jgi:hypothetical protein
MKAFHSVKAEMRQACIELVSPSSAAGQPARITRGRLRDPDEDSDSPIEPWMEAAFHGLTHASEEDAPFALVPCFMNGEPAVIIALAKSEGRRTHVMPLFLACQPWMKFSGQPEREEDAA